MRIIRSVSISYDENSFIEKGKFSTTEIFKEGLKSFAYKITYGQTYEDRINELCEKLRCLNEETTELK